ncbi:ATP11 protein-domain-containing protein [Terfezia claveryi]|nr:ATP11 protein-domain-containing protein [Terfezia claveryi]
MPYSLQSALRRTILSSKSFKPTSSAATQTRHARVLPTQIFSPSRSNRFLQTTSTDAHAQVLENYKAKLEEKMKAEGVTTFTDLFKTLSSYMDLPKLNPLPPSQIDYLWRLRHSSTPTSLCACIPTDTFRRLLSHAKVHPMFILPLPRPGGAIEMHFLQWTYPHKDVVTVLFTSLAAYKLHGEFAVPHTTLTHHLELMDEKGLVLAQGGVVKDRGVSVEEGRWLVMALQKFYGADPGDEEGRRRIELLEQFTGGERGLR